MEKIKGQLESYKEQPFSLVLRFLMWIATFLTVWDHSLYRRLYPHSWNTEPFTGDVCLGI